MGSYFLFFLLLIFGSCSTSKSTQHQEAKLSLTTDPKTLDPRKARDLDSITLIHMLFEGLTRTSKTGETELALADKVEISDDGLSYTFHLRESFWSNGLPLTASDFCLAWKTILDPHFATDIAYQLFPIKNARKAKLAEVGSEAIGIQGLDDHTLKIELEQPLPYFLELLSMTSFFPIPHELLSQNNNEKLYKDTFISNGPFLLQSWKNSDEIVLKKNNHYWEADSVRLSSIDFCIASPDTALQMYEEGKLDWIGSPLSTIPADAIQYLKHSQLLETSPFLGTYFYRLNTSPYIGNQKNVLADQNFRSLLAAAIDREGIVHHILQGGQTAARSFVPPEMKLNNEECIFHQNSVVSKSLEGPITITYANTERNAAVAQAVQNQWETRLGIKVLLEAVEAKVFFQRVSKQEYQIAAGSWTADFNDPVNFLEVFKYKDGSTNNTGWENPDYIDFLNQSDICKDQTERTQILRKAEMLLLKEMPIIPIFHFSLNYIKKSELSGVVLSPMGQLDLRWAYFEPSSTLRTK